MRTFKAFVSYRLPISEIFKRAQSLKRSRSLIGITESTRSSSVLALKIVGMLAKKACVLRL